MKKVLMFVLFCFGIILFLISLINFISAIGEYDLGGRTVACGERFNCSNGEQIDYCQLNVTTTPSQTIIKCECDKNPEKLCSDLGNAGKAENKNIFEKFWEWIKGIFKRK